jgi:hypothetical protein
MKIILAISIFFCLHSSAQNTYYFATVASGGNDSRTATQARSSATPWATITKLNTEWAAGTFQPGDTIRFKRGDTFSGSITPVTNGTATEDIVVSAYGTGAKPIISGYTTISTWNSLSLNVWESSTAITSSTTELFHLSIDGHAQRMAREPDVTDANEGYRTIKSHTSNTALTVAGFNPTSPSLVGKRAAVRTIRYLFDTLTIASVAWNGTDGTITFARGANLAFINGYGFFITRDSNAVDQHGEWYYNPVSKKVRVYTATNPSNYSIKAATTNTLLNISSDNYLRFEYLSFEGANQYSIQLSNGGSSNITFDSCQFLGAGSKILHVTGGNSTNTDWTFNRCLMRDSEGYGLDFRSTGSRMRVTNCTIRQIATLAGMNATGDRQSSTCININSGDLHQINDNDIDSIGYIGIKVGGSNYSQALRNYIRHFCMTLDDGGGIYWGYQGEQTVRLGNLIQYNTVVDAHSAKEGTNSTFAIAHGIYLDDNSNGIRVWDNNIANVAGAGIFLHNTWASSFMRNTVIDGFTEQIGFQHDEPDHPIDTDTIMYNKLIGRYRVAAGNPYIIQYRVYNPDDATNGELTTIGKIDSNYYIRPNQDSTSSTGGSIIKTHIIADGGTTFSTVNRSLSNWRSITPYDDNTKQSPLQFIGKDMDTLSVFLINPYSTDSVHTISQQYMTVEGTVVNPPTVTIPAYGSLFLMETGVAPPASNQSPQANAGNDVSVTLPYPTELSETLNPIEDAYTRNGSFATTNYGTADSLVTKSATASGFTRRSYLKFSLANTYETVVSATLRLYGRNFEDNTSMLPQIFSTTDGWTEGTLVWNTQPAYISGMLGSLSFNATLAYRTVDVSSFVQTQVDGDKVVSFVLLDTAGTQTKLVTVNSKENASNKPELVINSTGLISLNGASSSDQDGVISSYVWVKISGPDGGVLNSPTSASTTVSALGTGTYVYKLTVTDDDGATDTDTVNIVVGGASNVAPTANAGADQGITLPTSQVTVDAVDSDDSDGTIAAYEWSKVTGGAATITTPTTESTTITGLAEGVYVFKVKVTDDDGAFAEDQMTVTVAAAPSTQLKPIKTANGKMKKTPTGVVGQ